MGFDEQITEAFDTLTRRLRGEIDQEVQRRTAEAIAAAPRAEPAAPDTVAAIPAPSAGAIDGDRLIEAMRAIDAARSLTEILDALQVCAEMDAGGAAIWLLRGGRPYRWRAPQPDGAGDDSAAPSLDQGVPLTIGGVTVALLVVDRRTTSVDLLTRYASRALEALTAFKTARALTQPAAQVEGAHGDDAAEAEEDTSARRYARLLVSEIKLYHEPAVVDGRRDRDLATRLGGEIARARAMYEQRVPPHVRERADYFRDELVRTLCDGDTTLLEFT